MTTASLPFKWMLAMSATCYGRHWWCAKIPGQYVNKMVGKQLAAAKFQHVEKHEQLATKRHLILSIVAAASQVRYWWWWRRRICRGKRREKQLAAKFSTRSCCRRVQFSPLGRIFACCFLTLSPASPSFAFQAIAKSSGTSAPKSQHSVAVCGVARLVLGQVELLNCWNSSGPSSSSRAPCTSKMISSCSPRVCALPARQTTATSLGASAIACR